MDFVAFAKENWMVIEQAPIAFLTTAVIFSALGYAVATRITAERLNLAEARVADYKDKLEGRTPEEAAKQIADLSRRLSALEPLSLSQGAQNTMRDVLRTSFSRVTIIHDMASPENRTLVSQLVSVFSQAGWDVKAGGSIGLGTDNRPPSGIGIRVGIGKSMISGEEETRKALKVAGLNFDILPPHPEGSPDHRLEIVLTSRLSP